MKNLNVLVLSALAIFSISAFASMNTDKLETLAKISMIEDQIDEQRLGYNLLEKNFMHCDSPTGSKYVTTRLNDGFEIAEIVFDGKKTKSVPVKASVVMNDYSLDVEFNGQKLTNCQPTHIKVLELDKKELLAKLH